MVVASLLSSPDILILFLLADNYLPFYIISRRYVGKFVKRSDRVLPSPDTKYTNLYVKNLALDVTEEFLKEKFSEFGKVLSLVISKDDHGASKGFGFVNFDNPDDARRATEAMNGLHLGRFCFHNESNLLKRSQLLSFFSCFE